MSSFWDPRIALFSKPVKTPYISPLKLSKPEKGSKRDLQKDPKMGQNGPKQVPEPPRIPESSGPPVLIYPFLTKNDQNDHFFGPFFRPFFQNCLFIPI
jgi:hypothetical protein